MSLIQDTIRFTQRRRLGAELLAVEHTAADLSLEAQLLERNGDYQRADNKLHQWWDAIARVKALRQRIERLG